MERGGRRVLGGLAFAVRPGAALAVTGPNGVGKSSLLRALAGLLPSRGSIALRLGRDDDAPVGERLHYLGHLNGLKASLTALENLTFLQRFAGSPGPAPTAALASLGLAGRGDVPLGFLSAGQKRRVALAGLVVAPRPLWLLDEPATALDTEAEALLCALLRAHLASGGLAVLALHAPLPVPMATLRLGAA